MLVLELVPALALVSVPELAQVLAQVLVPALVPELALV